MQLHGKNPGRIDFDLHKAAGAFNELPGGGKPHPVLGRVQMCIRDRMYTKTEKNILMTVIKKQQITQLRKIVLQIDPSAFIIVSEATEVLGEGFQKIAP